MPAKNTVKQYVENSYYHIYNRGVEKRTIFKDKKDYKVLLSYLKEYLSPPPDPKKLLKTITFKGSTFKGIPRQINNYHNEIKLTAYSLMPNHFHFLIKQDSQRSIKAFMQSLATRYTIYFNKRYKRVGSLFQSIYKAVLIDQENYLLHLTRYIHLNPQAYFKDLSQAYSSYAEYLGKRNTSWVHPSEILSLFTPATLSIPKSINTYKAFVEDYQKNSQEVLGNLTLETTL